MAILIVGCGRMGRGLARGWGSREQVAIFDPLAPDVAGVRRLDSLSEGAELPGPLTIVLAVKPEVLGDILPEISGLAADGALTVSIVAGTTTGSLHAVLGDDAAIVRAMPNTPAAIGHGITALFASPDLPRHLRERTEALMLAVGEILWLDDEDQMDAVTALSGSGPAYFFRFAEALAKAGEAQGLLPDQAMHLARATFVGAGALAAHGEQSLAILRQEVTSPGGTTAAALTKLDDEERLDRLVGEAIAAATSRARELSR